MEKRNLCLGEKEKIFETEDGYVIYKEEDDFCEINLIELDNKEKNKGYGTKLMNSFLNNKNYINEFYLDAWKTEVGIFDIEILVKFYQKFGFEETDRMEEDEGIRVFMKLEKDKK